MVTRRSFMKLAGAAGATTALAAVHEATSMADPAMPPGLARSAEGHAGHGGASGHDMPTVRPADAGTHPAITKFSRRLPLLPTASPIHRTSDADVYFSVIRATRAGIYPGTTTSGLHGYFGGRWVPPVIRARQGRAVKVIQRNATDMPVSVHLHGGVTEARYDGQMTLPVKPGGTMLYRYANEQDPAALWMHDHSHMMDAHHVYTGMAAPYIISSPQEESLNLPKGEFEVPLMVRDGDFAADGRLIYTMDDTEHRSTILVNGAPWPYLDVKRRKYRFRVINASNMRFFVLGLSSAKPMTVIGGDGGLIAAPVPLPVVVLSPGERSDIVIDFAAYPKGTNLDLVNMMGPGPTEDVSQVMRFRVGGDAPDDSVVPATLTTLPPLAPATVKRSFTLLSSEPGVMPMTGSINGATFDMRRVDTTVRFGTTEEWTVTNANKTVPHNFHTHLAHFRVVDRDGKAPGPDESGWKDTVQIFPGQTVRLRLTFDKHRGVYPYHCHMLDHGAMGMMAQLKVV